MKMKIITIAFVLIGIAATAVLSGGFISSDYHITTSINGVELDGNTLYVNGSSNLPDGAVVEIGMKPGEMEPATSAYNFNTVKTKVQDGKWSSAHEATDYPGDVVAVEFTLTNMTGEQPDDVTKALGDEGQRINNPDIYIGDDVYDGFYRYTYAEEFSIRE